MTTPSTDLTAQAWAGARGDRWRAHLAGMEATLAPVDAPLIEALRLDAPGTIADVGCGGGAVARSAASK
ncbi:MAG: class I SAM-dependent methyltransferase, partial [Myxococcales bacterium]